MSIYRRLLAYLAPYRLRLTAAIACMAVYALTTTVSLGLVSPFMQVLFERTGSSTVQSAPGHSAADEARTLARAQEPLRIERLAQWPGIVRARVERAIVLVRPLVALERICLFILIVLFLKNLADYFQSYLVLLVEQAAIRDLRNDLQRHLQRLSLSFFHARRTGTLISRVTNDVEYLRNALASGVSTMGKDALTLAGSLGLAFYASWRLTLVAMLVIPAAGLLLGGIGRSMRRRSARTQEHMGDLTAILQETITGARVVRAFGTEGFEVEKFQRANQAFYRSFVRMRRIALAARPFSEFALVLVAVAMLWFGGREIFVNHSLAPHQFVLFVTALLTTISPVKSLAEVSANIQQGIAAATRLFELMDTKPDVEDRPGARSLPAFRDRIRYEGVTFAYPEGPPVLHDLSFEIRRGEVVALVGSSGSGKSTAMDLLPRFYDPGAGRITIDGMDVRDLTLASLRAQLGIVTQDDPVPRHGPQQHRLRAGRRRGRRDPRRRDGRARPSLHHRAVAGVRHGDRRAWREALGRRAPAPGDRAGAAQEPTTPAARRSHLRARPRERAPGAGGARAADAGSHRAGHRPPALDRAARRSHRRAREGPRGGDRNP